jgi:hypothetical protein
VRAADPKVAGRAIAADLVLSSTTEVEQFLTRSALTRAG